MKKCNISFVIPAKDEEKSIKPLYKELKSVLGRLKKSYEIIFVDDGSEDNTVREITKIRKKDKRVKLISLRGNHGKSIALTAGFKHIKGSIVITMDADLQDDPKELPKFLKKMSQGYDLVSGWKKERHDPLPKKIPSRLGNYVTRLLTGIKIHDLNCGYKVYKKEIVKNLNLYGELYKYIPVIAFKNKYRVGEVVVKHRKRRYGKSKFGWERNTKGFLDLLTIVFLTGYLRRPGHFFGTIGLISFASGFIIGLYITYLRITTGTIQYRQPLLFLGILLMIIGIQLITTGLLAELQVYSSYKDDVEDKIKETYL